VRIREDAAKIMRTSESEHWPALRLAAPTPGLAQVGLTIDSPAKIQFVAPLQKHHNGQDTVELAESLLSYRMSYGMVLRES
jgi:hypothetical protein